MAGTFSDTLRIGLLVCGRVRDEVAAEFGDYPELFGSLLGPHGVEIVVYDVMDGPVPDSVKACDGWLVSGSAVSTYDDLPWIASAASFVRSLVEHEAPLVAICFGHQLLAQAMGGRVEKSERGWGIGVHQYRVLADLPRWPDGLDPVNSLGLVASHQDQVTVVPDGAVVLAGTQHCPVAAYSLGARALAIQPHPEFDVALSKALTLARRDQYDPDLVDDALASLQEPTHQATTAAWMASFLRG
ncbi:MAG: GMP synthase [Aquihabitans sp.]